MTRLVADFIAQVNFGVLNNAQSVRTAYSKLNMEICKKLYSIGVIGSYGIVRTQLYSNFGHANTMRAAIQLTLKYHNGQRVLREIKIISRPGGRRYWTLEKLQHECQQDENLYILSTNSGILTSQEAILRGIGGEVLFYISIIGV